MWNIDSQYNTIAHIIETEDLKEYAEGGIEAFIKAMVFNDKALQYDVAVEIKNIMFHMPTAIFWGKMRRYLYGTFRNFSDQVKFASKFNKDNKKYVAFVKKQINLINILESDYKVDYYANLTRCYFLCGMDDALYFRLAKIIQNCTSEELDYVRDAHYYDVFQNNALISMLIMQGLISQEYDKDNNTYYVLSIFGKLLKKCSLNLEDEDNKIDIPMIYSEVEGIPQMEPIKFSAIDGMMKIFN
ncbi:MAG: hypothetical protein J5802_03165 [Butyrivibrio sp.]|nr:hypothetical protein [Butyrivibrio sp.]